MGREEGGPAATPEGLAPAPAALLLGAVFWADARAEPAGVGLALASGALASGCGYVIWYAALPHLSALRAASVQLSAPILAAIGGVIFISEPITLRLAIASIAVLGGVAIIIAQRAPR